MKTESVVIESQSIVFFYEELVQEPNQVDVLLVVLHKNYHILVYLFSFMPRKIFLGLILFLNFFNLLLNPLLHSFGLLGLAHLHLFKGIRLVEFRVEVRSHKLFLHFVEYLDNSPVLGHLFIIDFQVIPDFHSIQVLAPLKDFISPPVPLVQIVSIEVAILFLDTTKLPLQLLDLVSIGPILHELLLLKVPFFEVVHALLAQERDLVDQAVGRRVAEFED